MRINQITSTLGVLFYILAVITGLFLIMISTWGDMEADSYGFPRRANAPLNGLACPMLLTRNETGVIALNVSNPTDRLLHPSARTEISAAFEPEVSVESFELAPGASKRLAWSLKPENIVLGNFILANVQVYATYPIPNREKTCGILVMDLPGTGNMIVTALAIFTAIGLAFGLYSMSKSGLPKAKGSNIWNGILFLSVLIVTGLIFSFIGSWIPSLGSLVLAVLTSIMLLNLTFFREG
ncbi:MAG TPA: hypothetical protein VJM08_01200 [Anaerolineales bacterium]|nr:hypothetical protein [Anaerolineales bacterium]